MFGIGKSKKIAVAEKAKSDLEAREAAIEAREAALPDVVTEIFVTKILINDDGSEPCFVTSEYLEYSHKGLSLEDIAKSEAMKYGNELGIDLKQIENDMSDEDTVVYSFKHDEPQLTIVTYKYFGLGLER